MMPAFSMSSRIAQPASLVPFQVCCALNVEIGDLIDSADAEAGLSVLLSGPRVQEQGPRPTCSEGRIAPGFPIWAGSRGAEFRAQDAVDRVAGGRKILSGWLDGWQAQILLVRVRPLDLDGL